MDGLAFLANGNAQPIIGGGGVEERANLVVITEDGTGHLFLTTILQLLSNTRRAQRWAASSLIAESACCLPETDIDVKASAPRDE